MRIALFEPEIAGNVGAVLRLAACMGVAVHLIEPMGFVWEDRRVRRAAKGTGAASWRIEPKFPVDVLGAYVYLPAVES